MSLTVGKSDAQESLRHNELNIISKNGLCALFLNGRKDNTNIMINKR